ncbi:MAG TPA: hypothetical protein GX404_07725 [Syntrophomonadaceae bacterium]|jgi:hypothetical protein|nr:hypothetical protein [Syntrophomonadaceae bacterium]
MVIKNNEVDMATNLRVIEWLKTELLDAVSTLFRSLLKNSKEMTADALATIIISTYLLGSRVGISFHTIDFIIKHKLNNSINEVHEIEPWYGDLTELKQYMESINQKKR